MADSSSRKVVNVRCRACRGTNGEVVLDLGMQPACDFFPPVSVPGPDPVYPLEMWLCAECNLAQLRADPTVPEEPRGIEPAALTEQADQAVHRVAAAGWLRTGSRVLEYGSPHGGSWLPLVTRHGASVASNDQQADVILDCFGMMHCADQGEALAERAARLAVGGVMLFQYHSLATILRYDQWNALRHGHYAYYSTTALAAMLARVGLVPRQAWVFDLYGGTVLLAAVREADAIEPTDTSVTDLIADEMKLGVQEPARLRKLQRAAESRAQILRTWLTRHHEAGRSVVGYGAASRAVALLCRARIGAHLLPAVADASPAKQNRRMPGTDIPIVDVGELTARRPDIVLVFVPELLGEVRQRIPQVEADGGTWVDADSLGTA